MKTPVRTARALVVVSLLLYGGCRCSDPQEPAQPPRTPDRADALWPEQAGARWPPRCLIENIAVHPTRPWLTAACTPGAVMVLDAETGQVRTTTVIDQYGDLVGWSQSPNVVRWSADGRRLGVNAATNGIALVRQGRFVGSAFPDQSRDTGVHYVWVDDRIFADTGAFFEIRPGARFDFDTLEAPLLTQLEWNAKIGAVVGQVGEGIAAFDPVHRRLLYRVEVGDAASPGSFAWSSDGRSCAWSHGDGRSAGEVVFFDGDDGRRVSAVTLSLPSLNDEAVWSRDGSLFVSSVTGSHDRSTGRTLERHVDLMRGGKLVRTIDLGQRELLMGRKIPECRGIAPSPAGDAVALLLDGEEVQIRDAATGAVRVAFAAPAPPIPDGLPDFYRDDPDGRRRHEVGALLWLSPDRLVRVAPHFVSFWSASGKKIAELLPSP